MNELLNRTANVGLRLASAGSRFVLLLVLAKLLPPAEVGRYGLFLATVLLGVALLGVEFHAYSTRELLRETPSRWSFVIQHSVIAWLLVYILLAPVLWISNELWTVSGIAAIWLPSIMIVEHLCQETNRLLLAMKRPLTASALMFLRMGAWVWVAVPWLWFHSEHRTLDVVFLSWLSGASLAFLCSAAVIRGEVTGWRRWPISWAWLARGAGVGMLYLASSLIFRGIFTADRYLVQYLNGPDHLGVYVLFIGLSTAIITVIEPAVLSFLNPRLVAAWQTRNQAEYDRVFRELRWSIVAIATVLALAIAISAPFLVDWIGKPAYAQHQELLWVLLAMVWLCANGLPLDTALYARGKDRGLTMAMLLTLLVFFVSALLIAQFHRDFAVAWALLLAFGTSYFVKRRLLVQAGGQP